MFALGFMIAVNSDLILNRLSFKALNSTGLFAETNKFRSQVNFKGWETSFALRGDDLAPYDVARKISYQNWPDIVAHITMWVIPWLTLTSQIQFHAPDIGSSLQLLLLCVGSPLLALHSMFLAIFNSKLERDQDTLDVLGNGRLEDCRNEKLESDNKKKIDGSFWAGFLFTITVFCLGVEEGYKNFDGNVSHLTL
jgi:hypothetical protein